MYVTVYSLMLCNALFCLELLISLARHMFTGELLISREQCAFVCMSTTLLLTAFLTVFEITVVVCVFLSFYCVFEITVVVSVFFSYLVLSFLTVLRMRKGNDYLHTND